MSAEPPVRGPEPRPWSPWERGSHCLAMRRKVHRGAMDSSKLNQLLELQERLANSPAMKAAERLANSPAMRAAEQMADQAAHLLESPAMRAAERAAEQYHR